MAIDSDVEGDAEEEGGGGGRRRWEEGEGGGRGMRSNVLIGSVCHEFIFIHHLILNFSGRRWEGGGGLCMG